MNTGCIQISQLLVKDWVELFEEDYFSYRSRTPQSESTWKTHYLKILRRLPQHQVLTAQLLKDWILAQTEPDSRQRVRACQVLKRLAELAGFSLDIRRLRGKYNFKQTKPRDLPDDGAIAEWFYKIRDPGWQWVYGMLATYGLRPHEVFLLDLTKMPATGMVAVEDGKTGFRKVWGIYPEWIDQFGLCDHKLPGVSGSTYSDLGHRVAQVFRRSEIPFKAYDLRHAWAVRSMEFGLELTLASQQMGHSLKVHTDVYHHWISERHHQRAFDKLLARSDRPQAPQMQV